MTITRDPPTRRKGAAPRNPREPKDPREPKGRRAVGTQERREGLGGGRTARERGGKAARKSGPEASEASRASRASVQRHAQRMPFFLLLCALLGGALICALVISTTLAEGSFKITRLQQANTELAKQRQLLQAQIAAERSAQVIQARARQLGMRPVGELRFLDLQSGKIKTDAGSGVVTQIHVPGYTP